MKILFLCLVLVLSQLADRAEAGFFNMRKNDIKSVAKGVSGASKTLTPAHGNQKLEPYKLRKDYREINKWLVENGNDEPGLDEVLDLHEMLQAGKKLPNVQHQALSQFTSLIQLVSPEKYSCGLTGYKILKNNVISSDEDIMVTDDKVEKLRPIDKIIRDLAVKHAHACKLKYANQLYKVETENKQLFKEVELMMSDITKFDLATLENVRAIVRDPRFVAAEKAIQVFDLKSDAVAEILLKYIRRWARGDPNFMFLDKMPDPKKRGKFIFDEGEAMALIQRYTVQNCQQFLFKTENILKPAAYEGKLLNLEEDYGLGADALMDLMVWIQYYRLCDVMVNTDSETLVKNIVNLIREEF